MNKKGKKMFKLVDAIIGGVSAIGLLGVIAMAILPAKNLEVKLERKITRQEAAIVQRYEMSKSTMALCDINVLPHETAVWSGDLRYMWHVNFLALKSEFKFVVVEQNLPLPVAGTGYDAVMPKDHPRYKAINEVFDYVGDLMGREFIVVDDRQEVLGGMTADMADRVPVLELYLALDEGRYMGYPVAAWADQINGVLGVEVWWWYDDNMWKEGGYYTFLHEIGHLLGLGHVDESAGHETVMGGLEKTMHHMMHTKTFGLHDLAGLKYLWCTNPVKQ